MARFIVVWGLAVLLASRGWAGGGGLASMPPLTAQDRILVLVPHEDDEVIGAGGLLQRAVSVGAAVRVQFVTYGDRNGVATWYYQAAPPLLPIQNRRMGEVRRRESIAATARLGLTEPNLDFWGYPDQGVLALWNRAWDAPRPLLSFWLGTRAVPYLSASNHGTPFRAESVLADMERLLSEFRPTRVAVSHPEDANPDHRAVFYFLQLALRQSGVSELKPEIYCYPVHFRRYPRGERRDGGVWLLPPLRLREEPGWMELTLGEEELRLKREAVRCFRSQNDVRPRFLMAFACRNELFWRAEPGWLPDLPSPGRFSGEDGAPPPEVPDVPEAELDAVPTSSEAVSLASWKRVILRRR